MTTNTHRLIGLLMVATLVGCGGGDNAVAPVNNDPGFTGESFQWTVAQRTPVSETLLSVDGFGGTRIAAGFGGTFITRVGGGGWQASQREFNTALRVVKMINAGDAVAVGNNELFRTSDAGRTWKLVAESASSLIDVSVSGKRAIAVGIQDVLVSEDAGEKWKAPTGAVPSVAFSRVAHLNDVTAVAAANGGTLWKTVDGGNNWFEIGVTELPRTPAEMTFFTDKLGAAVVTGDTRVFWTEDGGNTWDEVASLGVNRPVDIDKFDATTGYVLLDNGSIHKTENSGKSWAFVSTVPPERSDVNSIDVSDAGEWVVVGPQGFVAESRNEGASWQRISQGRLGQFHSVDFANENVAVAAFEAVFVPTEVMLRSTNGGGTWTPVDPKIDFVTRVRFSDAGVGLAVGGNHVVKSTNEGASWIDLSPATTDDLFGIAIIDALTYFVSGEKGALFRTSDGGANWTDVSFEETFDFYADIEFFPGTDNGVILADQKGHHSSDGGLTWTPINLRAADVACATANVGIAVGTDILRCTDGGTVWSIVESAPTRLRAVAINPDGHGLAVGSNGLMMETLDMGLTWAVIDKETSLVLNTVSFASDNAAIAGGGTGVLLQGRP